jgi:hypothetical protein
MVTIAAGIPCQHIPAHHASPAALYTGSDTLCTHVLIRARHVEHRRAQRVECTSPERQPLRTVIPARGAFQDVSGRVRINTPLLVRRDMHIYTQSAYVDTLLVVRPAARTRHSFTDTPLWPSRTPILRALPCKTPRD